MSFISDKSCMGNHQKKIRPRLIGSEIFHKKSKLQNCHTIIAYFKCFQISKISDLYLKQCYIVFQIDIHTTQYIYIITKRGPPESAAINRFFVQDGQTDKNRLNYFKTDIYSRFQGNRIPLLQTTNLLITQLCLKS